MPVDAVEVITMKEAAMDPERHGRNIAASSVYEDIAMV